MDNIFVRKSDVSKILSAIGRKEIYLALKYFRFIEETYPVNSDRWFTFNAYMEHDEIPDTMNDSNTFRVPCSIKKYRYAYIDNVNWAQDMFMSFFGKKSNTVSTILFSSRNDVDVVFNRESYYAISEFIERFFVFD